MSGAPRVRCPRVVCSTPLGRPAWHTHPDAETFDRRESREDRIGVEAHAAMPASVSLEDVEQRLVALTDVSATGVSEMSDLRELW